MSDFVYTVHCQIKDDNKIDEWLGWLKGGHIADVMAGGAQSAKIIQLDDEENSFQVQYIFANRETFERYEREFAPALRDEGLKLFPQEDGFSYQRSTGQILGEF